ncbi:MAG: NAD(P)-binding domain-containing protein, partial [Oscillospiraceae bacterium]|nr:NAD(P)-binding domain-containing protein [Oscillospiraceae bacterium]
MKDSALIGFIGFGNMAKAIASGVLKSPLSARCRLAAYDPVKEQINLEGVEALGSAAAVAGAADYLFICVKPQQIDEAFASFADFLKEGQVLVSIAAGVSSERLSRLSGGKALIVRVMPDTPMLVGCGASATSRPEGISNEDYEAVLEVLRCAGEVYEIAPDKFDEVIPLAGSGVALFFRLAALAEEYALRAG